MKIIKWNDETKNIGEKYHYTLENINHLDGFPEIKGYDFEQPFVIEHFLNAFSSTGFSATQLGSAIAVTQAMLREKATIFLGYTSNMSSCGVREHIKFLVKHKLVQVLVTTAGGIEEDIIKTFKPFVVGRFDIAGKSLFEQGINRIGNIFVPNDRYAYFDTFMEGFLEELYSKAQENQEVITTRHFIRQLGLKINNEDSVLYWAAKNDIPVFCPSMMDGSLGDLSLFFKYKHPDFIIDMTKDIQDLVQITLNAEKTGVILLGGGVSKHFILNAQIFRDGADYAVYLNTGNEYDGSDAGASPDEAVTWAKIKPMAPMVKVHGDATILFPLLVLGSFKKVFDENQHKTV